MAIGRQRRDNIRRVKELQVRLTFSLPVTREKVIKAFLHCVIGIRIGLELGNHNIQDIRVKTSSEGPLSGKGGYRSDRWELCSSKGDRNGGHGAEMAAKEGK